MAYGKPSAIKGKSSLQLRSCHESKTLAGISPLPSQALLVDLGLGDEVAPALIAMQGLGVANDNQGGAGPRQPHVHAALIRHKANAAPNLGAHCAEDGNILLSALDTIQCSAVSESGRPSGFRPNLLQAPDCLSEPLAMLQHDKDPSLV